MKISNVNPYQLLVFYHVANEKNLSKAAGLLCLTQPTVTSHIKSLENALQIKLIEIDRKRVSLTDVGEGLYQYAKEIYTQIMSADRFVEHFRNSSLRIGVSPLLVSPVAAAVNTVVERLHNSVKINLKFAPHADLVEDVINANLDVAIIPDLGYEDGRLTHVRVSDGVRLLFFVHPSHPLCKKGYIDWKDLCEYPLLLGDEPKSIKGIITDKFESWPVRLPLKLDLAANNVECCKILVQNGTNISVALLDDIDDEVKRGSLKVLTLPEEIWMNVDAVVHRGYLSSSVTQHFIDCLKASF